MASRSAAGRRSPPYDRPYMRDLRIVLLGKNVSENNQVGNIIMGTAAFHSEASSSSQQHSVKISGKVEKRLISVINSSHLLQTHLSYHQITQGVRECVSLSAPGPHVILLVLQYNDFSDEDRHRVKYVLKLFSEKAIKHTIVLTTDEETRTSKLASMVVNNTVSNFRWAPMVINNSITNLIKECGGGHLKFDRNNAGWRSEMIRKIEEILKNEHEEFLICNMYENESTSVDEDPSRSGGSVRDGKKDGKLNQSTKTGSDGGGITSGKTKLNIVLCGYNTTLKTSVSRMIRGRINTFLHQKERNNVCVKKEERIDGRQMTVIELPALTRLSEEEVMRETLSCVSLCDPGVHVFILVTPVGSLINEDKAEMEKISRIFYSKEHFMVLFTSELTVDKSVSDLISSTESQRIVSLYGSWYSVMGLKDQRNSVQIPDLLDCIETMKTEPYSLQTYMRAQEKRVRHELEQKLRVRENEIKELQEKIKTPVPEGVKLNLVVCGSDRRLKSFISNLILNQSERGSELSSECVRRDVKVCEHLISLVELPALFNTQLSEEEVMRQTLRCVSLCDPGVHVFIIIIPDSPINNEDRAEMEEIQRIFSSRINKHIMILIYQNPEHQTADLNEETQSVIESFGGKHHFIGPNTQASMLMEKLMQMVEENSGVCFSTETLLEAQMEKLQNFEEMKKRIQSLETWFQSKDSREGADDLRIVLLGKTGVGKSATGNTILGIEAFTADTSQESVTKVCKSESAEINDRHVTVIDTPGLFDTELSNEKIKREITNCISMILPGPHVFLLLISVGRFTQEEEKSVKIIQETFGEKSLMYTIVLFTRGDDLKNKTIDKWLGKPGSVIRNLIEACGNRYHVFNNNQTGDRTQVSDLLKKIDDMVKENGDSYYSCKMFREMEQEIQEQQKMILMERVEQLKKEKEEIMKKHKEEKKKMKMMMEEERQNHYKERKTREEEFRKSEEQYRRDIKEREEEEGKMRKEMKNEREEWERQKQEARQRRDEENERRKKIEKAMWDEYYQKLKEEIERRHTEREDLLSKHEEEMKRVKMKMDEERQNHEKERKRREEEFREREEQYKTEMKREREEWERQKQQERQKRDEEDERRRKKEQAMRDEYYQRLQQVKKRMMMRMEEERQNLDKERKRREEEYRRDIKDIEDYEREIQEEMKRE